MRRVLMFAGVLFCAATWAAQDSVVAAVGDTARVRRDSIFAAIMQSLPRQLRVRVDSAHALQQRVGGAAGDTTAASRSTAADTSQDAASLKGLPEELRERIQQSVRDIEREQQGRPVEFKDQKQGPRR